ncbi:polycystic kidney disease 1 like 1-like [Thalassophryne amazonica]|uniref:polycystic kidney disease 1 like 1-like n=1 Tax=Thalassophryne amazonica TaxID=390379 RepID=UPI001471E7C3|nr:polycystic kidney disease 1 like 1-like [Thalassophryne amazonica]
MKTLTVMKASRTLAAPAAVFTRSLCSLFWPMISGLILLMALSSVGNLIFCQTSWVFSSLPHSLQTVLCHLWGFKSLKILLISGKDLIYKGATHLSSTTVWTSMVMGVVMSWVQITQRSHSRRDVFTLADLTGYIRWRLSVFTGLKTPTWSENHMETKTYYLEEFESLVDELLFRLCVLSSCHPLPPRAYCYRNNSPHIAPRLESSNVDSETFEKSSETEETAVHIDTDVSLPHLPQPHPLRKLFIHMQVEYGRPRTDPQSVREEGVECRAVVIPSLLLQVEQCSMEDCGYSALC